MKPVMRRTFSGSFTTEKPLIRASPPCGESSVARIRIVVVLPAPFGPMKPSTWPRSTLNDTSSTARTPSKCRTRPSSCSIGSLMVAPRASRSRDESCRARSSCGDAGLPERRALEHRQVGAGRLMLDEMLEPRRQRQVRRHDVRRQRRPPAGGRLRAPGARLPRDGRRSLPSRYRSDAIGTPRPLTALISEPCLLKVTRSRAGRAVI